MVAEHGGVDYMISISREGPLMILLITAVVRVELGLLEVGLLISPALGHDCVLFMCRLAVVTFRLLLRSGATRLV